MEGDGTVIIHSFVTDGYYDFAISLIESFKKHHGESIPFLLHSKNLSDEQIGQLYSRYKKLTVKNSNIDWDWLQEASQMDKEQLQKGKTQVEKLGNRYMSKEFYHWKHYISIYSRYRDAIAEAFDFAGDGEHILHLDIDLFISKPIDTIFNLIKLADVSLLLRPSYDPEWRKVYGCILGFTVNQKSREFHEKVCEHIHSPDFLNIPKGWGQTVFWRAYNDLKDNKDIKFAEIPKGWVNKGFDNKGFILSANNGLKKRETAKRYKDMRKGREVEKLVAKKSSKPVKERPKPAKQPRPTRRSNRINRGTLPRGVRRRVERKSR